MKVAFFLRGKTIWARLTVDGVAHRFTTKVFLPHGCTFDSRKQEVSGRSTPAMRANSRLADAKALIMSLAFTIPPTEVREQYLRQFMEETDEKSPELLVAPIFRAYVRGGKSMDNKSYADGSISLFNSAYNSYIRWGRDIDLIDFDLTRQPNIQQRMALGDRWKKFWRQFDDFLSDELELMANSRASYFRMVNTVLTWAERTYYVSLPHRYSVSSEECPIVVLDPNFVKRFMRLDMNSNIYQVSAMILMTTLRVSDIVRLKPNHFELKDGQYSLRKKNHKTGAMTTIPLHPVIGKFLGENIAARGTVFPEDNSEESIRLSMPKFFSQFPECQEMVTVYRGGQEVTEPLWTYCKPHMLRKSAITTMIYDGVDERFIKFASGHSAGSSAFERYVAHVDRMFRNRLQEYYASI